MRADIDMLSDMLGQVVEAEDPGVHALADEYRKLALRRAEKGDERCQDSDARAALDAMVARTSSLAPRELRGVARVFTATLNLANAAEVHHRVPLNVLVPV